jgi:DNA-binding NarL/FixJ family response regulator
MPRLLRDVLEHAIQLRGDCELVRETRGVLHTVAAPTPTPDIVILGLSASEDTTLVQALFARWPTAQVVTVAQAGEEARVYELQPRQRVLGQMSPAEIVESLREAVHQKRRTLLEDPTT